MKKLMLAVIALFFMSDAFSQTIYSYKIRSYNESLVLQADHNNVFSKYMLSVYGDVENITEEGIDKYLFQGQEYDKDLGNYLFPARLFNPKQLRFIQPDPQSQYFSPYLFVNGDPVNKVDFDGNEGLPLVIYQQNHDLPGSMTNGIKDIQGVVPDAHYVPMSSFINGEVGDLPEWNGKVFFSGHVGDHEGRELLSEESFSRSGFKTGELPGVHPPEYNDYFGKNIVTMDGKEMGKSLRRFSEERGVPVRSVTVGGCEGHWAAESIHKGFMEESQKFGYKGQRVKFKGLKDGRYASYVGEHTNKSLHMDGYPKETRLYLNPSAKGTEKGVPFERVNGKKMFTGYKSKLPGSKRFTSDPYVEDGGIRSLVHDARTPSSFKKFYGKIVDVY